MDVPLAHTFSRPGWLNLRTTLGVILFALALLVGQRIMADTATSIPVWVATHDLGPNFRLTTADLKTVDSRLSGAILQRYASASRDLSGSVLTKGVAEGELLPLSSIIPPGALSEGRSMTLPITPEHAVGGQLQPGDRVDIFASFNSGEVQARTTLIARAVAVVDVVKQGGFAVSDDSIIGVTVAVTPDDATRLAFATHNSDIDVVRVDGGEGTSPSSTVDAREFR